MMKTLLISAALAMPCAANTINFYSGVQPDERNNSGYAIQTTGPGAFGGFAETVPGLHDEWKTGTVYSFDVRAGLLYGVIQTQALNGDAVQLDQEWLQEHGTGSGPQMYIVDGSHFAIGANTLAVFFFGPGNLSSRVSLVYSDVPEPVGFVLVAAGLAVLGFRRNAR